MKAFSENYPGYGLILIEDNLEDLSKSLSSGLVDLILVPDTEKHLKDTSKFVVNREPLYFVEKVTSKQTSISIDDIAQKTFLMVPDSCGLAIITRGLFGDKNIHEYEGRAMSYQVLENWALSGLGAAIIPKSKITQPQELFTPIIDDDTPIEIGFCAYWKSLPLTDFEGFLAKLVS